MTGALSGFLDNAPTYLTFFNTVLGSFFPGMSEAEAVPLPQPRAIETIYTPEFVEMTQNLRAMIAQVRQ